MNKLLAIMGFAIGVSTAALAQLAPAPAASGPEQVSMAAPSAASSASLAGRKS
jgi:hypothetical protein